MQAYTTYEINNVFYAKKALSTVMFAAFNRINLDKFLSSDLSNNPSVYILFNESTLGQSSMYIGETENIGERLTQHDKTFGKTFWTNTVVLQTSDSGFNKAHFKHLEFLFYQAAVFAERYRIANKVVPTKSSLSHADKISAQLFFEESTELLLTFRYLFFEHPYLGNTSENEDIFYLYHPYGTGKLQVIDDSNFNILKDSVIILESKEVDPFYSEKEKLIKEKKIEIIPDTDFAVLKSDIKMLSDNDAAAFVLGNNKADWTMWTNVHGVTIMDITRTKR